MLPNILYNGPGRESSYLRDFSSSTQYGNLSNHRVIATKIWICFFLFLPIFVSGGCRSNQAAQSQIDQMRADNVALMDHYVSLRSYTEKLQKELETQGKSLPKNAKPLSSLPLVYPPPGTNSYLIDQYDPDYYSSSNQKPVSTGNGPSRNSVSSNRKQFPVAQASFGQQIDAEDSFEDVSNVLQNRNVADFITIRPQEFHGLQLDDLPGDDGVRIVLQPRDSSGNLVLKANDIQVTLIDTSKIATDADDSAQYPEGKVVGSWAFPKKQINQFLVANLDLNQPAAQAGIPLKLSFAGKIPSSDQLLAIVTYKSSNGRQLMTKEVVRLDLTGLEKAKLDSWESSDNPESKSATTLLWKPTRK